MKWYLQMYTCMYTHRAPFVSYVSKFSSDMAISSGLNFQGISHIIKLTFQMGRYRRLPKFGNNDPQKRTTWHSVTAV